MRNKKVREIAKEARAKGLRTFLELRQYRRDLKNGPETPVKAYKRPYAGRGSSRLRVK